MNINKKAVILILIIVVCVIISALISNKEYLNTGAPIGGRCKRSSDCANHSGIDKITCLQQMVLTILSQNGEYVQNHV